MIWLVEVGWYRKVIPPVDDISAVFLKTVHQPASSLPNVHYRWTLGARQAINHVFSDAGKMSRDVNICKLLAGNSFFVSLSCDLARCGGCLFLTNFDFI